jgi:hypothetical protein
MDVELLLAVALRCARFSGLADDAIAVVMGGQLVALLAGEEPLDLGPAPGPSTIPLSPGESRLASLLSGAGGCMLGGGDPAQSLELALLALAGDAHGGDSPLLVKLIEEARSPSPQAIRSLVLALTMAMTPGVGEEALAA